MKIHKRVYDATDPIKFVLYFYLVCFVVDSEQYGNPLCKKHAKERD